MRPTTFIAGLIGLSGLTSAAVVPPASQENSTTSPLSIHGFGFSKDDMETALIKAIALPLSEPEKATLAPRDDDKPHRRPMPPRDMLLAEQITHDDLPICYQNCMRKNDGKSSIHMGKDTLGKIGGIKWPLFIWWCDHHLFDCVSSDCPDSPETHERARCWLRTTFDKPKDIC